ncbi:ParB/RepB/Spo0J family partition protein [Campylobacter sp. RM9344]|uniref:ParB/RepB/Spo0J family partition protein n=2 Tax=Campylobacteraceae TaxID=72294 RepID=A0AAW3ZRS8_9BACT|nr:MULTISPECIES: ParB/RepB/Spo0J family partition protein [unclassified Campylobacter]MBE2984416.1 ParB/RepB/Spo0J family partition protein [Campylobacter sp. RM6883]MBE2985754.1 ParB/RepB/Spo0J family partition protein [Campylobacter sp. RM12919]MBE2987869.1 ParB/RepB/Spo0J family partition protein [Campylobacter sp. RM12920]MBE2995054.1 ParB/RepB/Spo0J family partition protein [Campylobacter sp. RM6913]MBE3021802.1 ParB/RepB/Spo0J family partition protein [Campylobacter sp. 7477a]MBE3029682
MLSDANSAYKDDDVLDYFGLSSDVVEEIDVAKISPNPYQPRKNFDEEALKELAQSIKRHGLIQPIIVIRKDGGYMLIAGERRFRATKLLNESKIKAIVANLESKNLREIALIENIQRENLNPIELANSYKELISEYKITQEGLSNIIHKSRTQITNTMRLLLLSETTKRLLQEDKITQGHAKVIVGLKPDEEKMVVDTIIGQKLSVRETENLVKKIKSGNEIKKEILEVSKEYESELSNLQKIFKNFNINAKIKSKNLILKFDDISQIQDFINRLK